ncbi:hypothetical protein K3495_g8080 [Podosphaera aphanis]|nr:hypothetical protein K3495_g8080 [Podosphaera aphanis]
MSTHPVNQFPCILTVDIPFPTTRLASIALQALRVDQELSPLVQRSFTTIEPSDHITSKEYITPQKTILRTEYKATTNRMLRVAINGFMESLTVIIGIMEELDVDITGAAS